MEIVLIRHGQPEWEKYGRSIVDPPLTDLGHRQAAAMASALAGEHFDEVIVSPLLRARQTAAPLLAAIGSKEVIEPWLAEVREPDWHGQPSEHSAAMYREERTRPAADRWEGLAGGESLSGFASRIQSGASDFLAARGVVRSEDELPTWRIETPGARVAVIAHAGTNTHTLGFLLGIPPTPWEWDRFVIGHSSITKLVAIDAHDRHTFSLSSLGNAEHLSAAERTR